MFEKGKSGNPVGRPKKDHRVQRLARLRSVEAIERLTFWMRSDDPKASVAACIAILNRAFGRPAQALTAPDGTSPAKIIHEVVWAGSKESGMKSSMAHARPSSPTMIDISAGPSCLPIAAPEKPLQPSTTKSSAR
jgi:hypothetical protein